MFHLFPNPKERQLPVSLFVFIAVTMKKIGYLPQPLGFAVSQKFLKNKLLADDWHDISERKACFHGNHFIILLRRKCQIFSGVIFCAIDNIQAVIVYRDDRLLL